MHTCVGRGGRGGAVEGISSGLTRDEPHQQLSRAQRAVSAQVTQQESRPSDVTGGVQHRPGDRQHRAASVLRHWDGVASKPRESLAACVASGSSSYSSVEPTAQWDTQMTGQ